MLRDEEKPDLDAISLACRSSDPAIPTRMSSSGYFRHWTNTPSTHAPCLKQRPCWTQRTKWLLMIWSDTGDIHFLSHIYTTYTCTQDFSPIWSLILKSETTVKMPGGREKCFDLLPNLIFHIYTVPIVRNGHCNPFLWTVYMSDFLFGFYLVIWYEFLMWKHLALGVWHFVWP